MLSYHLANIKSTQGKKFISNMGESKDIVLLVGSAISKWKPAFILEGNEITKSITRVLTNQIASNKAAIRTLLETNSFEYVNQQCPNTKKLEEILRNEFFPKKPNDVHKAIYELVNMNKIHSIITTNYDNCFESILPNGFPLKHINVKKDTLHVNSDTRVLFKIHGCADPAINNMVFCLSQEGVMVDWKSKFLTKILENKLLLVLGYSGLDFEVCPELMLIHLDSLIWNSYKNPKNDENALSDYAKNLLSRHSGLILNGDLRDFIKIMGVKLKKERGKKVNKNFIKIIKTSFSINEILEWACSVFAPAGYVNPLREYSGSLLEKVKTNTIEYGKCLSFQGEALFSKGHYRDAITKYKLAIYIFERKKRNDLLFPEKFKLIDSIRCYGNLNYAYFELNHVKKNIMQDPKLKRKYLSNICLQEVLILRESYERNRMIGFRKRSGIINKRIKKLLKIVAQKSAKDGKWYDLQQAKMWANRLDIPFNEIYDGPLQPLEEWFGYRKLGHIIAEMMAARDSLLRKEKIISATQMRKYIRDAKLIGTDSENWKLVLSYMKHFANNHTYKICDWLSPFMRCQYTPTMRIIKLFSEAYR